MIALTSTYPNRKGIKKSGIPQAPCVLATFLEGMKRGGGNTRSSLKARLGRGPRWPPGMLWGRGAPPGPSNSWPFKSTSFARAEQRRRSGGPLRPPGSHLRRAQPPPAYLAGLRRGLRASSPARAPRCSQPRSVFLLLRADFTDTPRPANGRRRPAPH